MKKSVLYIMTVFLLLGIITSAYAAQITTEAIVGVSDYETHGLIIEYKDTDSGSDFVTSNVNDDNAESHASGTSEGYIAAKTQWSAASGNFYDTAASVTWSETFIAAAAGSYRWDFAIPTGELLVGGNNSGNNVYAGYDMTISVNGNAGWCSIAELTMYNSGESYDYYTSGVLLDGTLTSIYNYDENAIVGYRVEYNPYNGSVELGSYNVGDEITIEYIMAVIAGGPAGEVYASAYIGDPGELSHDEVGEHGIRGALVLSGPLPVNPVPEPATMFLLGTGLVSLVGSSRKKLKK